MDDKDLELLRILEENRPAVCTGNRIDDQPYPG